MYRQACMQAGREGRRRRWMDECRGEVKQYLDVCSCMHYIYEQT